MKESLTSGEGEFASDVLNELVLERRVGRSVEEFEEYGLKVWFRNI